MAEPENMPCREVSIKSPGLPSGFRMFKNVESEEFYKPRVTFYRTGFMNSHRSCKAEKVDHVLQKTTDPSIFVS